MILIAESGSTKTDWRLILPNGAIKSFHTIGFNPYYIEEEEVFKELSKSGLFEFKDAVNQLFFYGAGCSSEDNCRLISTFLSSFFTAAEMQVNTDILAAARATCGNEKGIVAILGTGSNSCKYDGKDIVENVTSLGYILGDYGSGADIGKQLITAFLENELPQDLEGEFRKTYNLDSQDVINSIYKKALPNRFLAGFNPFVAQHISHPYLQNVVRSRIELFLKKTIVKYSDYQNINLNLAGSISFIYETIIREEAHKKSITIGKIIKAPIEALVSYHLN